ncbi:hypothetical protein [Variovorax sp. Sphag1AA]|uniref:hypothetical protein n=1 Tax=Variovorax sp. Sphag1AA TaxID=2587027 RepID=UPI00160CCE74|nr:hypothetical protein [Variovorax sp. Sphag1AA]MBB3178431.1 hypothetical protein [Variovorax sp. Sphag1AA]
MLHPIIRDCAGDLQPIPAALAALTGQPVTAVVSTLRRCFVDLKPLAGVGKEVAPEDACHAALYRFGYQPHRLYADHRRHRALGELLTTHGQAPGEPEALLAICENGSAFAFFGGSASSCARNTVSNLAELVRLGELDLNAEVRFAITIVPDKLTPIASPDHKFLESLAIPAFALADAYNIEVIPLSWPYWSLTFPGEMTDGEAGSGATQVCGEHELLSVINDRVRAHESALEIARALLKPMRLERAVVHPQNDHRTNGTKAATRRL